MQPKTGRFRLKRGLTKNRTFQVGLVLTGLIIATAIFAPYLSPYDAEEMHILVLVDSPFRYVSGAHRLVGPG